jgi:hypothetical protein
MNGAMIAAPSVVRLFRGLPGPRTASIINAYQFLTRAREPADPEVPRIARSEKTLTGNGQRRTKKGEPKKENSNRYRWPPEQQ